MRRSESQRAVLTNYILVIVAGVSGFLVQQQLRPITLPLSILVTVIGGYGAVIAANYHERANYHLTQARALTTTRVDLGAARQQHRPRRRPPKAQLEISP
jgi:hypothetical protein